MRIFDFDSNNNLIVGIQYKSRWIVAATGRSQVPISTVKNRLVFGYDSLNNPTYLNGLSLTLSHMFPLKTLI